MKLIQIFSAVVVGVSMLGCAAKEKKAKLEDSVEMYVRSLRENDEIALLSFVHPDQTQKFLESARSLKPLSFSHIEVRRIYPDEKMDSALVTIDMEYFTQEGSQLFSAQRTYTWNYDLQKQAWLLNEASPFGR